MSKTYKKNSEHNPYYKMVRRSWGAINPSTKIESPKRGDGSYQRRDKSNPNIWQDYENEMHYQD